MSSGSVNLRRLPRAINSVVHSASHDSLAFAQPEDFEDELMQLIARFLGWPL